MQYAELSMLKQRVLVGNPLPFNVRDADRSLLLARGHVVMSHEQMEALFERGALVDIDELKAQHSDVSTAPRERLPALWRHCMDDVGRGTRMMVKGGSRRMRGHRPNRLPALGIVRPRCRGTGRGCNSWRP